MHKRPYINSDRASKRRKRPLFRNVPINEPGSVASRFEDDESSDGDNDEEYEFHSILRTNKEKAAQSKRPQSSKKNASKKATSKKRTKKVKLPPQVIDNEVPESSSGPVLSLSEGSDSENKRLDAPETVSEMWHCSNENLQHIHRAIVGNMQIALYRLKGSGVALGGSGWVKVIQGTASVLGSLLSARSAPFFVVSAPLAPFAVTIAPCTSMLRGEGNPKHGDWLEELCNGALGAVGRLKCEPETCIVLFAENCEPSKLTSNTARVAAEVAGADVPHSVSQYLQRAGLPTCPEGEELVRGLSALKSSPKLPCFIQWTDWSRVMKSVFHFMQNSKRASDMRLLFCGPSGSGKSTAVRCMINFLLSWNKEVVLIDTDVGQPEMNIPGLVAAHSIRAMRSGATAVGNRNIPIEGGYFGDLTPREDVELYTMCVSRVVESGCKYAEKVGCAVVVNSDGWVSDTGAELLAMVADKVAPSHIFALKFLESQENNTISELLKKTRMDCAFVLTSPLRSRNSFYSATALRDLHVTSYFGGVLSKGQVFELDLDSVQVATMGEFIPRKMLLAALNASLIALAATKGRDGTADWNTLGFGIVRGVDARCGSIYVATPLKEEQLEKCDAIIISTGMHVPSGLFLAIAETSSSCIKPPYIEANVVSTGGQMKSRSSLMRKQTG